MKKKRGSGKEKYQTKGWEEPPVNSPAWEKKGGPFARPKGRAHGPGKKRKKGEGTRW